MAIFGINTPEFGVSERISDLLGKSRNAQGGSNLFGKVGQAYQAPAPAPIQPSRQPAYDPFAQSGSVLGAQTASGGGAAPAPVQGAGFNQLTSLPPGVLQQVPQQAGIDYDALISPALQALDQAIAPAESQYQANVAGIDAATGKLRGEAQSSLAGAQSAATSNKQKHTQTTESAIDEARRQFSELQQGLQARYGSTTGTGQFASEIAGSQALKNIAGYRQNLATAVQGIDDKLEQVRSATDIYIRDLEESATSQKSQAKAQLDQALNQIRLQKGELQGRKAELAANAIQLYQNTVNDITARNTQFMQQLYLQQTQAEQQLQAAKQKATKASSDFSLFNVPQGSSTLMFDKATGAFQSPGAGQIAPVYTNQGAPEDDEDIFAGG